MASKATPKMLTKQHVSYFAGVPSLGKKGDTAGTLALGLHLDAIGMGRHY